MDSWKTKKRIIIYNIIIIAILFGLVSLNKEYLHPEFNQLHFVSILTGSFPDFIAAFIISLAFGNAIFSKKIKLKRGLNLCTCNSCVYNSYIRRNYPNVGARTQYVFLISSLAH